MRFRLTLWYSSLLLVFGLAFVIALNVAARMSHPDAGRISGLDDQVQLGPVAEPGRAIDTRPPPVDAATLFDTAEAQIYRENLDRLRSWSLIAVVGLVITSGVGGYVVSGVLLGPVREISRVASEISATNLSRRINHQGVDDELKELADTFDSMIERLEAAFVAQQQFVQDASHELRTPLAAIRTNIEVLELDPNSSVADFRELMDLVKSQTERLTRLADDLLLLTRPAGPAHLGPVSLPEVLSGVVRELGGVAAKRGTHLSVAVTPGLQVVAEEDHLFRCLSNLLDNAIKYSGPGAAVALQARPCDGGVEIAVRDNGPGIPPEALPHVFERFYRVDRGRSRREGGSGLGLAIVRELVTRMRGSVDVNSTPGVGSTFRIVLPSPGEPRGEGAEGATAPGQGDRQPLWGPAGKHPN